MNVKPLLSAVVIATVLTACTNNDAGETSYSFVGSSSYQLNAADVYRLSKQLNSRQLLKALRPLYKERYFSKSDFQAAVSLQLHELYSEQLFDKLVEKSFRQPEHLRLDFVAENTIKLRFGQTKAKAEQQLLNLDVLPEANVRQIASNQFLLDDTTITVDEKDLCVVVKKREQPTLSKVCPIDGTGFTMASDVAYSYAGLGQEFQQPGDLDGRWNGRTRHAGNKMEGFNDGATGNTHIPILYATAPNQVDLALYLNNLYSSEWTFGEQELHVKATKGASELYLMTSEHQRELRQQFMQMSGTPLVPPRKMFGMWLSEYGFDNWTEMDGKLATLRENQFPIDGVVMDLQWFGNVKGHDPESQMGTLTWDRRNFPNPEQKIATLQEQGVGMMLIEESYVSEGLEEFSILEGKSMLARDPRTGMGINVNSHGGGNWWGKGGMIDWSNPAATEFWHDWKRQPLVDMGVMGHWTDLGEPEMYNGKGIYFQDQIHDEIHNLFNYYWLEGIYQGYERNAVQARPFMMSRSGTTGVQKFGTSMWSADIGSNLSSLAVHYGQQSNMMLSGIDYYGSDIGGFHRKGLRAIGAEKDKRLKETYTQWFAYSSLFDVPVRPHTENLCNCKETAPDRVGDLESNRANLELRYELIPYLYSLAHVAYRHGEPLFSPLSYQFEDDANTHNRVNQKMIGKQLMSPLVAELGARDVDVYFPNGIWYNYRTGTMVKRGAGALQQADLYPNSERYELPLYAVDGAIIPVSTKTLNGWQSGVPNNLAMKLFGLKNNQTVLYEDDGKTTAYTENKVRLTDISTHHSDQTSTVILKSSGHYPDMPRQRNVSLDWYLPEGVGVDDVIREDGQAMNWSLDGNLLNVSVEQWTGDAELVVLVKRTVR